jgi:hypothetical protein
MRHSYALATLALSALMLAPADQVAQAKNDKSKKGLLISAMVRLSCE